MTRAPIRGPQSSAILTALACVTALTLSSCSTEPREPSMRPSEAKQSIIEQVEGSSAAIGGHWERYSGPGVMDCGQSDGTEGAAWEYIIERTDTDGIDPKADVAAMSARWKKLGIDVEEYESGGKDPWQGVRGRGGPVLSIGFDAVPGQYTITGVSHCSDGDPAVLRREH